MCNDYHHTDSFLFIFPSYQRVCLPQSRPWVHSGPGHTKDHYKNRTNCLCIGKHALGQEFVSAARQSKWLGSV